ncbi:MAG: phage Gp37/Gp68 family protein [Bacteroides sp.]|nr:phage Gp37/Gp68 family protein [Eubacterium sp.]MCM1418081.1 phage Gp37/Gp68 family protein [Roseburia sp.]MCM1462225.1 phage Gp37/Gp68 family protein [Bacteroides sp.]
MAIWNPWHGCHKYSTGCKNCYMFRRDAQYGRDSNLIGKNATFSLPIERKRDGSYRLGGGEPVYTCMTSDFFIEEADGWRGETWGMIHSRPELTFVLFTKRIERFYNALPDDWGEGYENVALCLSCEDQEAVNRRAPLLLEMPIRYKMLVLSPMLEAIDVSAPLASGQIREVTCAGESGENARLCDYGWILSVREQCIAAEVPFFFQQTGALFRKDGRVYHIPRSLQHEQARKAGINYREGVF